MERLKIAFIWKGSSDKHTFNHWEDGLYRAMKYIEEVHDVKYIEPTDSLEGYDVLLLWEAPCTINNKEYEPWYRAVQYHKTKKALLFAGGPMLEDGLTGFDLVFTESQVNDDELKEMGIPHQRAFGINDDIFHPISYTKEYDGMHHATCASWKRQGLLCKALKEKALVVGRNQVTDPQPFITCKEQDSKVMEEQSYEDICDLINMSHAVVNTSELWGGGQRAVLESISCGVPCVVMNDSPKNMEFIEESGAGLIIEPNEQAIRDAVEEIKTWSDEKRYKGVEYVANKWSARHYAQSLLSGINKITK